MNLIIGRARAQDVMPIVSKINDKMILHINRKSKIPLIFAAQQYLLASHTVHICFGVMNKHHNETICLLCMLSTRIRKKTLLARKQRVDKKMLFFLAATQISKEVAGRRIPEHLYMYTN